MHQLVQEYIEKKKAEQAEKERKEKEKAEQAKNDLLMSLGLYEKEYSDTNQYSVEYPYSEYDKESHTDRYYKQVPIEVTDEEYAEILKYRKGPENSKQNKIANIFKAMAWSVFFCGFIAGIIFGIAAAKDSGSAFSFEAAFAYWAACFVSGMLFLGFAEIIQLLTDIKNK